jgi:hypothetical protein
MRSKPAVLRVWEFSRILIAASRCEITSGGRLASSVSIQMRIVRIATGISFSLDERRAYVG